MLKPFLHIANIEDIERITYNSSKEQLYKNDRVNTELSVIRFWYFLGNLQGTAIGDHYECIKTAYRLYRLFFWKNAFTERTT